MRLIFGAVVALGIVISAPGALVHNDTGIMRVTSAIDAGQLTIRLDVGLVYSGDKEHAGAATVTATGVSSTGATFGPVAVPHVSGESWYAADITVPTDGSWTVTLTSVEPTATATATVAIAPLTTTTAPTTTVTTTTEPTATTAATTTTRDSAAVGHQKARSMGNAAVLFVVAAALVAVGSIAISTVRRRRKG